MAIDTGTAVLIVINLVIGLVAGSGVPFAFTVVSRLTNIETSLTGLTRDVVTKTMDSTVVHDELFSRVHKLERTIDRCTQCREAIASMDGSDG